MPRCLETRQMGFSKKRTKEDKICPLSRHRDMDVEIKTRHGQCQACETDRFYRRHSGILVSQFQNFRRFAAYFFTSQYLSFRKYHAFMMTHQQICGGLLSSFETSGILALSCFKTSGISGFVLFQDMESRHLGILKKTYGCGIPSTTFFVRRHR